MESIFNHMKDLSSAELRKLVRHAARIMPPSLAEVEEEVGCRSGTRRASCHPVWQRWRRR